MRHEFKVHQKRLQSNYRTGVLVRKDTFVELSEVGGSKFVLTEGLAVGCLAPIMSPVSASVERSKQFQGC